MHSVLNYLHSFGKHIYRNNGDYSFDNLATERASPL